MPITSQQALKAKKIKDVLTRQRFADWYNEGNFASNLRGDYPEGHLKRVKDEKVLEDIVTFFEL